MQTSRVSIAGTLLILTLAAGSAGGQELESRADSPVPIGANFLLLGYTYQTGDVLVDPSLPGPGRPRWFDLDRFRGPPRLSNWIVACDDLAAALVDVPAAGVPMHFARGDLSWQMAVPEDGLLPFDGAFPALIQWAGSTHPTKVLPDSGARLMRLEIAHPDAEALRVALADLVDPRVVIAPGSAKAMRAEIKTPNGTRVLE